MTTRSQYQMEWGTAAEIAAFAGAPRELVFDTTNGRIVVMIGTGTFYAQASEAYVQAQLAAALASPAVKFARWLTCT